MRTRATDLHGWWFILLPAFALSACDDGTATTSAGGASASTTASTSGSSSASTGTSSGTGGSPAMPVDHGTFGSGKRLRARYLDAGGGAISFTTFFDTTLGVECEFRFYK